MSKDCRIGPNVFLARWGGVCVRVHAHAQVLPLCLIPRGKVSVTALAEAL